MLLLAFADLANIWDEGYRRYRFRMQNAELEQSATDGVAKSRICKGIAIYVSPLFAKWI